MEKSSGTSSSLNKVTSEASRSSMTGYIALYFDHFLLSTIPVCRLTVRKHKRGRCVLNWESICGKIYAVECSICILLSNNLIQRGSTVLNSIIYMSYLNLAISQGSLI